MGQDRRSRSFARRSQSRPDSDLGRSSSLGDAGYAGSIYQRTSGRRTRNVQYQGFAYPSQVAGMIDTEVLWRFFVLWLVTVPTPGANSLMVTHLSLTRPAKHVGFALIGHIVAVMLLALCALLGWAALLELFPSLRTIVGVLGGAYLIYCGWLLSRRARSANIAPSLARDDTDNNGTEPSKAFFVGFATALSNAQAILFITSIFAVTGVLTANLPTAGSVLGIIIVCNLSYLSFLGWIFRRPTIRAGYQRFRHCIEGVVGALFVVFGLRLIIREVWR